MITPDPQRSAAYRQAAISLEISAARIEALLAGLPALLSPDALNGGLFADLARSVLAQAPQHGAAVAHHSRVRAQLSRDRAAQLAISPQ